MCFLLSATPKSSGDDLESGFVHPPPSARAWVNWFWLDGNITREGITADLEAMQRVGIGGVLLMDITQEIPPGPVRFGTRQWRDMFHHTISEAGRLGLEVNMHNGPGWSGSGGPWITPALAMQKAVWSKTNLTGPAHFDALLPPLPMSLNYARDVATLAFPTLVGDGIAVPGFAPKITASEAAGFDGAKLLDGNPATSISLPAPAPRKPQYIQLEFTEPFTAAHLKLAGTAGSQSFQGVLQVSDDGKKFRNVREFLNRRSDVALDFEQLTARYFRILFTKVGQASRLAPLQFSELELAPIFRLDLAQAKAGLGPLPFTPRSVFSIPHSNVPPYALIRPDQVLDLTSKVDANGRLTWDTPKGRWTVLRFGSTPTGRENHPTPPEGRGLECDKLSKEAIAAHFAAFLAKLLPGSAGIPAGERAFSATHIDSWEHGYQNWTPRFPEEFQTRRGYNLLPYLPTFTGRIVANPEISERFLWDMRRTIADLWADNYAGHLAELAHQHGLQLSIEAYANGPFDELLYAARADVPMGEFWAEAEDNSRFHFSNAMASTAHTCGKSVVAAEAFTSYPVDAKWQNHPFSLKPLADAAFSEGINRLVFHRYAHQPWLDRTPGMTMGQWGIHYERTETWWEQSKPWHEYLARCQFLLQRGLFVADICFLTAEGAYTAAPTPDKLHPSPPVGYDYDIASPELVLNRMSVKDHRLSLPDGMSYSVLVLPPTELMTPKLLSKIKELVQLGATVVGPRPSKSPSLTDYPNCDKQVKQFADELWANCDGKATQEHAFGQGKIVWGKPLTEVLASLGAAADFEQLTKTPGHPLRRIHRKIQDADFYFVANSNSHAVTAECAFRASGKQPEFWYPDSGKIVGAAAWRLQDGRTIVPFKLGPAASVFVVFRQAPRITDPVRSLTRDGKPDASADITLDASDNFKLSVSEPGIFQVRTLSGKRLKAEFRDVPRLLTLSGPWDVHFPPSSGAPPRITLPKLISWTEHSDSGVKHFSGTAAYTKTVAIPAEMLARDQRLRLDLGQVQVIAQVSLNGRELGILWKPPFRVDITEAAKVGDNVLEVKVTNLWPNRLIGDEQLPDDCLWRPSQQGSGSALVEWPKWVLEGKPSPTGRLTFTTWKHWFKDSRLLESGLLGPVTLQVKKQITLDSN